MTNVSLMILNTFDNRVPHKVDIACPTVDLKLIAAIERKIKEARILIIITDH